jgi:hypothetical protein
MAMRITTSLVPPFSDELLFENIFANRHATAIMEQIIGPMPMLCWASSGIALENPADVRQAVHSDAYADIRNFTFCVGMNIYPQDNTAENGGTELWPVAPMSSLRKIISLLAAALSRKRHSPIVPALAHLFTLPSRQAPSLCAAFACGTQAFQTVLSSHGSSPHCSTSRNGSSHSCALHYPSQYIPKLKHGHSLTCSRIRIS